MSQADRMQILKMIAEGKVSPEEGDELLGAVDTPDTTQGQKQGTMPGPAIAMSMPLSPQMPLPGQIVRPPTPARRKLVIQVHEEGEQRVNVTIPLAMARVAAKLIPRQALSQLEENEINLDELMQELVNVEGDGTLIQIQDGDENSVRIAVE